MTKPYRIKHNASGYFYQRYNGSNLGKKGKVYMNNQSPLTMCDNENFIRIQIRHNTLAYKALRDMLSKYAIGKDDECEWHSTSYRVPKSEFEKEELQLMKIENIKFKAKRLDNNTWVEGYFYSECGNAYIIENRQKESKLNRNLTYQVDPSTVCQFTGLKDSEGKEIWEGDIVHDSYDLLCIDNLYEVVYIEEEGTFAFKSLDKVDNYEPFVNLFEVYVVGNKFDNEKQYMRIQTALSDKLKKHCSHHAFIKNWMHDCVEWGDCNILFEKIEQKNKYRMTNEEFCNAHIGERVLYKGKDIGAYVAGYIEDKYIILGFDDYTGCILYFTSKVYKTLGETYNSYRFAKLKYLEIIE